MCQVLNLLQATGTPPIPEKCYTNNRTGVRSEKLGRQWRKKNTRKFHILLPLHSQITAYNHQHLIPCQEDHRSDERGHAQLHLSGLLLCAPKETLVIGTMVKGHLEHKRSNLFQVFFIFIQFIPPFILKGPSRH